MIGGGVQGTYISNFLTGSMGVPARALGVLDPHPDPMHTWQQHTSSCGMQFLRSPAAHHIGLRTNELLDFARQRYVDWPDQFLQPYLRPSLELWNEHARHVVSKHRLDELRIQGTAQAVRASRGGYEVLTETDMIPSRRLVICPGSSSRLNYPMLDEGSDLSTERVRHVFDPCFSPGDIGCDDRVAIIGSGVTAAQLATRLCDRCDSKVQVLTDRLPQISWFDSDPGWNGPRLLGKLAGISDPVQRQEIVHQSRIRGSFPGDTAAQLLEMQVTGRLLLSVAAISSVKQRGSVVNVMTEQGEMEFDRLVFATGFSPSPPAPALLAGIRQHIDLPTTAAGWPVVNEFCEWTDSMYLGGSLAQLELGPVSRNISGIRGLARRIRDKAKAAV